jgi:hypothetical protein
MYTPDEYGRQVHTKYTPALIIHYVREVKKIFNSMVANGDDGSVEFEEWAYDFIANLQAVLNHPHKELDMIWTPHCVRHGYDTDIPGFVAEKIAEYNLAKISGWAGVKRALSQQEQSENTIDLYWDIEGSVKTVQVKATAFFGNSFRENPLPNYFYNIKSDYVSLVDTAYHKHIIIDNSLFQQHIRKTPGRLNWIMDHSLHFFNNYGLYDATQKYIK